jgi:hypothetical protein
MVSRRHHLREVSGYFDTYSVLTPMYLIGRVKPLASLVQEERWGCSLWNGQHHWVPPTLMVKLWVIWIGYID